MPNYGICTNFMFCKCYLKKKKKEKTSRKEAQKGGKCNSLCRDIIFVCRDTKFKQAKETMSNHQLNVATKLRQNSMTEREILS